MAEQASGSRRHTFAWLAAFVAVSASAAGFASASTQPPAQGDMDAAREIVTEYRTATPSIDAAEAAELVSERQRLNRIKRNLNARKRKLDRRRAALDAREAELDAREAALGVHDDGIAVAGARSESSEPHPAGAARP